MSEAIPQDVALKLQLAAIGGNEPETSFIEVRALPAGIQEFIPVRDFEAVAEVVKRWRDEHEVFVGMAPRTRRVGKAEAVARVWSSWVDCDTTEAVERLRAFRPLPSIVTRSGSADHLHAAWSLRRPLSGPAAQRANRRLALALGADMGSTDPPRVLRPVGGFNHKSGKPVPVICTRLELDVFTAEEVTGKLPDSDHYVRRTPQSAPRCTAPSDADSALAGLVNTVASAPETNRNKALYWASCRVGDEGLDTPEARAQLRSAAEGAGLSEFEAERTIRSALERAAA